jgi:hypothetical protein
MGGRNDLGRRLGRQGQEDPRSEKKEQNGCIDNLRGLHGYIITLDFFPLKKRQ